MRINPVITAQPQTRQKQNAVSFKSYNPEAAARIEREIMQKGIFCNTKGNDFVASCYKNVVELFEKLFGRSHLPERLEYENFYGIEARAYAYFNFYQDLVNVNKNFNSQCYDNMDKLKAESKQNYNYILPSWSSTKHPAHTFAHEFSHAAHWHHLENRNGWENA